MKTLSSGLRDHLSEETTTLATFVKITRRDGIVKGFTTHDRDVLVSGVTYKAEGALTPSAIENRAGLAVDNLDITGVLDSTEISEDDIDTGLYDFARIDVSMGNWADVTQGVVQLRRGWLGQVTRAETHYVAEVRGLHDLLQRPVGDYYTPECRFDLGDRSCGIGVAALTVAGTATSVTNNAAFADTAQTADTGTFDYGVLTWTSGANEGQSMDIKAWDKTTHTFTLWLPMPDVIAVGDAYTATPGCDKRFATCKNTFSNGAHFGGFPYVPGVGNILAYPS